MMNSEHIHEEFRGHFKDTDTEVVVLASATYTNKERATADRKIIRVVESSSLTTDDGEAINLYQSGLFLASTGKEIVVSENDLKTIISIGQGKYQVEQD